MTKIYLIKKILVSSIIITFGFALIIRPDICKNAVISSIVLCGKTLIPAVFPFCFCVIFLTRYGILEKLEFLSSLSRIFFGISGKLFGVMLLSMIGGYPIGAKLLNDEVKKGALKAEEGRKMLNYCVNAGPAFILSAVGFGILNSKELGYILLFSHIFSSLIICVLTRFFTKEISAGEPVKKIQSSISQSFVYAANTAADITVDICSFVVLFSVVTAFTDKMQRVKPLFYPLEITNALTKTHNLYIISFLLGFGGICIWFQIFSVGKELKIEIKSFALMRILHGAISTVVTALLLEIHIIAAPTFSNNKSFVAEAFVSGKTLGVSLIVMAVIFIISLSNKEGKIKILEEFI